ncbi:MAG TPA: prepilin peptidase [Ruminiclostridium sp.]|nr:prepilin peptidase [Ruminiclostridium sp.]
MLTDILVFLSGLCAGSFLNVCIDRIPLEKPIFSSPPTCTNCGSRVQVRDRIPVLGYIMLKGKCRNCKTKISIQYPLVELLTGLLWLLVYRRYGAAAETIALIFLFSILTAAAFIDLKYMIIPDSLVLAGLAGGIPVFLYHVFYKSFSLYFSASWYAPLIGMVSASGILLMVAFIGFLIYKDDGAMGMGDVKLFLPIGLFLGWRLSMMTLFIAVMLAGIVSAILLIFRVLNRKSAIPFGPFIVMAAFITGFFGPFLLGIL